MPKVKTLEDVKPLLGNLARPNYYQVQFGLPAIPTENLFRLDEEESLVGYLRAKDVDDRFVQEGSGLLCSAASLPGRSLARGESYNFAGVKEKWAHTEIYDDIRLEFYVDNTYKTLKFFEYWMTYISNGKREPSNSIRGASKYLRYPDEYKSNSCKIYKFENDNRSIDANLNIISYVEYNFFGLFPVDIFETPLQYSDDGGIMNMTVSFSYDQHIMGDVTSLARARGSANGLNPILRTIDNLNNGRVLDFINP